MRVQPDRRESRVRGLGGDHGRAGHVCVDDATCPAYVEVLGDQKARTAIGFLRRALTFYRAHGIEVQ
jgi:hypothetical protein